MSWQKIVESRIQDAMAAGQFRNLKGEGEPLPDRGMEAALAGDNWIGYHILSNGNHLPSWLELAKQIEHDVQQLQRIEDRFRRHLDNAGKSGRWDNWRGAIMGAREDYEVLARKLRAKQDKFNIEAPAVRVERPAIWVEHELGRLDSAARIAGAPPEWFVNLPPAPLPGRDKADPGRILFGVKAWRERRERGTSLEVALELQRAAEEANNS